MAEDEANKSEEKRTVLPPAGEEEMMRNINPKAFLPKTLDRFKREIGWTKADPHLNREPDPQSIQNRYVGGKEKDDTDPTS